MSNLKFQKGYAKLKIFIIVLIILICALNVKILIANRRDKLDITPVNIADNDSQPAFITDFKLKHRNKIDEVLVLTGNKAQEHTDIMMIYDPIANFTTANDDIYKINAEFAEYFVNDNTIVVSNDSPISMARQDGLAVIADSLKYQINKQHLQLSNAKFTSAKFQLSCDKVNYLRHLGVINFDQNVHIILSN